MNVRSLLQLPLLLIVLGAFTAGCAGIGASQSQTYSASTDEAVDIVEDALVRTGFSHGLEVEYLDEGQRRVRGVRQADRSGGTVRSEMVITIEPGEEEGTVEIAARQNNRSGHYAGQQEEDLRDSFFRTLNLLMEDR